MLTASSCISFDQLFVKFKVYQMVERKPKLYPRCKTSSLALIALCSLEDNHINNKHKMSPLHCWHFVYLCPNTAWDCSRWGWKVPASPCFGQFGSLLCCVFFFFFCLKVLGRTKHLAPDTSRPVTHLVDRPGDRGKDRWMENSMAGRRVGGGRYCRF